SPAREGGGERGLSDYLLAIDQGTTSTRAIVFDATLRPVATAQQEFAQVYPAPGRVEHDVEDIWSTTVATVRAAIARAGVAAKTIAAIGIANQREAPGGGGGGPRPPHPKCDRLAGSAHGGCLRRAAGARRRAGHR